MADKESVMMSWCAKELFYWQSNQIDIHKVLDKYDLFNKTSESFFIFHFHNGSVSIADKPDLKGQELQAKNFAQIQGASQIRAWCYYRLFSTVAPFIKTRRGFLGMDMQDVYDPCHHEFPVFCFQKDPQEHGILIPDIDFLLPHYRFYTTQEVNDSIPYNEKLNKAVFVGSTTGCTHKRESVKTLNNPRLNAGVYFRDNPEVDFYLPNIVQCDTPETEAAIRALGLGNGKFMDWHEQFKYRFLISMDGNGATCSRVAIALKSNSVLLKYHSPKQLFYFSSLIPWLHYIPIKNHSEVAQVIAMERAVPGYFRYIANAGAGFSSNFLCIDSIFTYTANLLKSYFDLFFPIQIND